GASGLRPRHRAGEHACRSGAYSYAPRPAVTAGPISSNNSPLPCRNETGRFVLWANHGRRIAMSITSSENPSRSRRMLWIGYLLSGLVVAFLVMDMTMKLANLPVVSETGLHLGWQ